MVFAQSYKSDKILERVKSSGIYLESLNYLKDYEPVAKYVGVPIYVSWVKEVTYDKDSVMLVVPFKGPKGKASLIINGIRGRDNEYVYKIINHVL